MPGVIDDNSDYSESGDIKVKLMMQMEYWAIIYYTLLISIIKFLRRDMWVDRVGLLPTGALHAAFLIWQARSDHLPNMQARLWKCLLMAVLAYGSACSWKCLLMEVLAYGSACL